MRGKDADAISDRLQRVEQLLDKVERSVDRIELVTVIREPNTGIAADAYNGLRKQIIAAVGERTSHLTQLAQLDAALRAGATTDDLASLAREWLAQASMTVVEDVAQAPDAFELVGDGDGADAVARRPAYMDNATGRTVRMGVAERLPAAPVPEAEVEPAAVAGAHDDETSTYKGDVQ